MSPGSATGRVRALLAARLSAGPRGGLPIAAMLGNALVTALFCGLVSGALPAFAYGLFALSLVGALLAIPLLGELGWLLRADAARVWIEALPARAHELAAARALHLVLLLGLLALAALLPAAWFAPGGWMGGALLLLLGCGLTLVIAAALVALQALLGGRAEAVLVLLQTVLVVGVLVGLVSGLRHVSAMRPLTAPSALPAWAWSLPSAWFAAPLAALDTRGASTGLHALLAVAAALVAFLTLVLVPAPEAPVRDRREPLLARILVPLRAFATRAWVRPDERAFFDLVYDALPREREFVLRTYPMLGIPLAFLAVGASESSGRVDLLALLFFSSAVYLPILLTQIPASESAEARWLHELAPVREGAVVAGTIKALTVRFLAPLYLVLFAVGLALGEPVLALRLAPPGFLLALVVLIRLYPVCVTERPLSVPPDEVRADLDWIGLLGGIGVGLALIAFAANRWLTGALGHALLLGLPLALAWVSLHGIRRRAERA